MSKNYQQYRTPNASNWEGRATEHTDAYWYQVIQLMDAACFWEGNFSNKPSVGLLGYACDEGVRRNLGRVGAVDAPIKVRERLGKLAYHGSAQQPIDFGDVCCVAGDMEGCQQDLAEIVTLMLSRSISPIVIGGGHDIAYGHFLGINNFLKTKQPDATIGIINFDAHFDLRPVEQQPNSGTPFNQILSEFKQHVNYFAIGIQQSSNTKKLFEIAKNNGVGFVLNYDCNKNQTSAIKEQLSGFVSQHDYIYLTIDMDVFSSAFAPGVSAPSALGIDPFFFFEVLQFLLTTKKVISCDIAEFNPTYDIDNTTANLVARIVDFLFLNYR